MCTIQRLQQNTFVLKACRNSHVDMTSQSRIFPVPMFLVSYNPNRPLNSFFGSWLEFPNLLKYVHVSSDQYNLEIELYKNLLFIQTWQMQCLDVNIFLDVNDTTLALRGFLSEHVATRSISRVRISKQDTRQYCSLPHPPLSKLRVYYTKPFIQNGNLSDIAWQFSTNSLCCSMTIFFCRYGKSWTSWKFLV